MYQHITDLPPTACTGEGCTALLDFAVANMSLSADAVLLANGSLLTRVWSSAGPIFSFTFSLTGITVEIISPGNTTHFALDFDTDDTVAFGYLPPPEQGALMSPDSAVKAAHALTGALRSLIPGAQRDPLTASLVFGHRRMLLGRLMHSRRLLDEPGCDGVCDSRCNLRCCYEHDTCFKDNKCTELSWARMLCDAIDIATNNPFIDAVEVEWQGQKVTCRQAREQVSIECNRCNRRVVWCIVKSCAFRIPTEPLCYNAKCDKTFTCPGVQQCDKCDKVFKDTTCCSCPAGDCPCLSDSDCGKGQCCTGVEIPLTNGICVWRESPASCCPANKKCGQACCDSNVQGHSCPWALSHDNAECFCEDGTCCPRGGGGDHQFNGCCGKPPYPPALVPNMHIHGDTYPRVCAYTTPLSDPFHLNPVQTYCTDAVTGICCPAGASIYKMKANSDGSVFAYGCCPVAEGYKICPGFVSWELGVWELGETCCPPGQTQCYLGKGMGTHAGGPPCCQDDYVVCNTRVCNVDCSKEIAMEVCVSHFDSARWCNG